MPGEITEAYHKARRSYGLYSGLLLGWELIGAEVTEAPFPNLDITLKSPEAIPYVLIVLVLYFAFRFTVEFYQCSSVRRAMRPSRIDFTVAHSIGALALGVYLVQRVLQSQIVEQFSSPTGTMLISFSAGFWIVGLYRRYKGYKEGRFEIVDVVGDCAIVIGFHLGAFLILYPTFGDLSVKERVLASTLFLVGLGVYAVVLRRRMKKQPDVE